MQAKIAAVCKAQQTRRKWVHLDPPSYCHRSRTLQLIIFYAYRIQNGQNSEIIIFYACTLSYKFKILKMFFLKNYVVDVAQNAEFFFTNKIL